MANSKELKEDLKFGNWLEENGYKSRGIQPWGNDLYRAISYEMMDTTESYMTVRRFIASYIQSHPDEFIQTVSPKTVRTVKRRAQSIRVDGVKGNELSIVAASKVFRINICVLRASGEIKFFPPNRDFNWTMYLSHRCGDRYDHLTYSTPGSANRNYLVTNLEAKLEAQKEEESKLLEIEFRDWLHAENYQIVEPNGNSNVMPSVVGKMLNSDLHRVVRAEVAGFIEKNPHDFLHLVNELSFSNLCNEIDKIRSNGKADILLTLTALTKMYQLKVVLVNPPPDTVMIFGNDSNARKEILIARHPSGSYSLLTRIQGTTNGIFETESPHLKLLPEMQKNTKDLCESITVDQDSTPATK